MTILQALNSYYDRMAARGEVQTPGWSVEKFGWCIVIDSDGEPVDVQDWRDTSGKKPVPRLLNVPAAVKRTVGIAPNFLWDKTAYVLGRTAGEGRRTVQEHTAFRQAHAQRLAATDDEGLLALRRFLERWSPERFNAAPFVDEMLDANIAFRLDGDGQRFIHHRPAARALVEAPSMGVEATAFCLVTGTNLPVARLHPSIKGVEGAQTAGASLVSFNLDAFKSYGAEQGDNAPTSQAAAFRYGAALNRLLDRGSRNRLRIGDATVVFWADASDAAPQAADGAEAIFGAMFAPPPVEDAEEAAKLRIALEAVRQGRPAKEVDPRLAEGTRFNVLGLSPNAARLSVRYWLSDDFTVFARRLADHYADLAIEPSPWRREPSIDWLLRNSTALQGARDRIPAQLAGEVTRAILEGRRYPRTLLAAAVMRLRAGDPRPDNSGIRPGIGWHAAVMRAVLARAQRLERADPLIPGKGETPVALDREHLNPGYLLGRLFAVYELAQIAALGRGVKATIRDKYFGSASATPASIFAVVIANGQNHLSKARKTKPGWAVLIERELNAIMDLIEPAMPHTLPRSLRLEDQAEFAIGYYHQRSAKLTSDKGEQLSLAATDAIEEGDLTDD